MTKIRTDFVTNSSSSSFIVIFNSIPKSEQELKNILFPDKKGNDLIECYDNFLSVKEIVRIVFDDIKEEKPNDKEKLEETIEISVDVYEMCKTEDGKYDWETAGIMAEKLKKQAAKDFLNKYKGKTYYILRYSDNDGATGCLLEHGDIFRNVEHIRISEH